MLIMLMMREWKILKSIGSVRPQLLFKRLHPKHFFFREVADNTSTASTLSSWNRDHYCIRVQRSRFLLKKKRICPTWLPMVCPNNTSSIPHHPLPKMFLYNWKSDWLWPETSSCLLVILSSSQTSAWCCLLQKLSIISIAKRCSYNSPAQRSHPIPIHL